MAPPAADSTGGAGSHIDSPHWAQIDLRYDVAADAAIWTETSTLPISPSHHHANKLILLTVRGCDTPQHIQNANHMHRTQLQLVPPKRRAASH